MLLWVEVYKQTAAPLQVRDSGPNPSGNTRRRFVNRAPAGIERRHWRVHLWAFRAVPVVECDLARLKLRVVRPAPGRALLQPFHQQIIIAGER
jgi:hypothetical protein